MRKSEKLFVMLVMIAGVVILNSCNKEEVESTNLKTISKDYLSLFSAFNTASEEEITSGDEDDLKSAEMWTCLNVTIHENENGDFWPRSWTLDYGEENCETFSGNTRRGKIHVTLSDWWRNEGSSREIVFEDYYFNDNQLEGVKTITNNGENDEGHLTFSKGVTGGKLIYTDGSEMKWDCQKVSELIEGNDTFRFFDDVWSVTGSGAGVNRDGAEYTFEITDPLIYQNGCFYPVSGVVEIVTEGSSTIIDYGNGECDKVATVTTDGVTTTEEL